MESQRAIQETPAVRLGLRLRRARLARNLTQSEVAQKQFSVSYISAVERGQIRPSLGALEKLAERLQVPLSDLLSEDDAAPIPAPPPERVETSAERDEVESRLREAQILSRQGKVEDALDVLRKLSNRALTQQEQVPLHWHLAYCYIELQRGDDARREIQEAIPLAEKVGDIELRERLRNELGNVYHLLHRHQLALDQYRACLEAIEAGIVRDITFRLNVLYNLGNQYWHLGDFDTAIEYLSQAATLAADVLNPERLGSIYWMLSTSYSGQGDTRRAKLYALRSLAAYEDAGNRRLSAQVYNRLGRAYVQAGQLDEALVHLRTARDMAEQQNDARGVAEAQRSLAAVYLRQDAVEDAERAAAEAAGMAEATGDRVQQGESELIQAHVAEAQHDLASAEQHFERALAFLEGTDAVQHLSDAYAQFSTFLEQRGESGRALDLLKRAWQLQAHGTSAL